MPHQNPHSSRAGAQNPASEPNAPNDQARSVRPAPRSYAAGDVAESSLALPAAGEVADDMDEGEALGEPGLQQGRTNTLRPGRTEAGRGQGRRTLQANRQRIQTPRQRSPFPS